MKTKIHALLIISIVLLMLSIRVNAQKTIDSLADYSKYPVWISMIDNPKANYYEAITAFDTYYKYHKKPKDEDESQIKDKDKEDNDADDEYLKSLSPEELNNYAVLKYQVKRFENWLREMKPFVQEDGRILTDEERAAIWKKQQEEIKQQHK